MYTSVPSKTQLGEPQAFLGLSGSTPIFANLWVTCISCKYLTSGIAGTVGPLRLVSCSQVILKATMATICHAVTATTATADLHSFSSRRWPQYISLLRLRRPQLITIHSQGDDSHNMSRCHGDGATSDLNSFSRRQWPQKLMLSRQRRPL